MAVEPKRNAYGTSADQRMHRLWNPETGCYLHLSGKGETPDVGLSWLGYQHQAKTLADRAAIRGEPWPYRRRSRDVIEPKVPGFDEVSV